MSGFSEEGVQAKLSSLNETQDSIVTVASWISFHKRHAHRSAEIWLARLKESGAKRLNLIYLANEIVQQAKFKRKDDLVAAFSPLITEGTLFAYKSSTSEVQLKIRRVVAVWRERQIFSPEILDTIGSKVEELDKTRSGKRSTLGGSLFSSTNSSPPELQAITKAQLDLTKASTTTPAAVSTAETEYTKLTDPATPTPTPPVHAARLSALLKTLSAASSSLSSTLEARRALLTSLETLLSSTRTALSAEESQLATLTERKSTIETKKRDVEDGIMRGLSAEDNNGAGSPAGAAAGGPGGTPNGGTPLGRNGGGGAGAGDDDDDGRPDIEALTPPPATQTTEDYEPNPPSTSGTPLPPHLQSPHPPPPHPQQQHPPYPSYTSPPPLPPQAGADLLSSLMPGLGATVLSPGRKRKLEEDGDHDEGFRFGGPPPQHGTGDAMAGLDEDVAELLRQEGGGGR